MAAHVRDNGQPIESPHGRYIVWPPQRPEQLWLLVSKEGGFLDFNPHFAGAARIRVRVDHVVRKPDEITAGYIHCWASPVPSTSEPGDYPLIVDCPDFDLTVEGIESPSIAWLQAAAFAWRLECWPSDDRFQADQEARLAAQMEKSGQSPRPGQPKLRGFAPESFIPSGTFSLHPEESTDFVPKAEAIFSGHVLSMEAITNPHTSLVFHHLHVRSTGGEFDVVADPEVVKGEPVVGGVIQGTFWLSARIAPEPAQAS